MGLPDPTLSNTVLLKPWCILSRLFNSKPADMLVGQHNKIDPNCEYKVWLSDGERVNVSSLIDNEWNLLIVYQSCLFKYFVLMCCNCHIMYKYKSN